MRRSALVVGLALGILTAAGSASAADETGGLATQGQFIFSADRLFSVFSYQDTKIDGAMNTSTSTSSTQIGLFSGVNNGNGASNFFAVPRLGFDYTITPNITVGGSIFVFANLGSSTTETNGSNSMSNPAGKLTYWGLAPRAGYIFPITDSFSFWGRLGFSFIDGSVSTTTTMGNTTTTTTNGLSQWAIDVEPMFVFSPVNHFGFVFGPTVDIPLTGSASNNNGNATVSFTSAQVYVGVQAGLLGYF